MDDTGRTSPHNSHASRSTSATLAGSPPRDFQDHDHEDSPMRKKPRLDANEASSTAITSTDFDDNRCQRMTTPPNQSATPPSAAPPTSATPSRVTLNLRTPQDQPSTGRRATRQQNSTSPITNMSRMSHQPLLNADGEEDNEISFLDGPKPSSPPVVDISLDDTGSEDEQYTGQPQGMEGQLSAMVHTFPWQPDHFENAHLLVHQLEKLATWFSEWVEITRDQPELWPRVYAKHYDDFIRFGNCIHRLLTNKTYGYSLQNTPGHYVVDFSRRLIESYLDLCGQLAVSDSANLREGSTDTMQLRFNDRSKHLKNLTMLLTRPEHTTVWRLAARFFDLDAKSIACDMAPRLLMTSTSSNSWYDFAAALVDAMRDEPVLQDTALQVIKIGNEALSFLIARLTEPDGRLEEMEHIQYTTQSAIQHIVEAFFSIVGKQTSTVSSEFAGHFLDSLVHGWKSSMTLDPGDTDNAIEPWAEVGKKMEPEAFADVQGFAMRMTSFRRLIGRGRLELRVCGTVSLGFALRDIYAYIIRLSSTHLSDGLRECTAQWLAREGVVEQIVNIDTHPAVVQGGENVLGFVLITNSWPSTLTGAVFDTIVAVQDIHLKMSIIKLLQGVIQYASSAVLKDILERICASSASACQPRIVSLCCEVAKLYWTKDLTPESLDVIFTSATHMLREMKAHSPADRDEAVVNERHISELIHTMSQFDAAEAPVQKICKICVDDVQACSSTVGGSAAALHLVLFARREPGLRDLLVDQLHAPDVLSDSLVKMISACSKGQPVGDALVLGFPPLIGTVVQLMLWKSDHSLIPANELALWQCLVGDSAINDQYRNHAWSILRRLPSEAASSHPFLERCIQDYLPIMDAKLYTHGLVEFVKQAVQYCIRVLPSGEASTKPSMQDVLVDLLWTVVLNCLDDDVAHMAMQVLCDFYTKSDAITRAPLHVVAEYHEAFVDKAVRELSFCATDLRVASPDLGTNAPLRQAKDNVQALRFKRAIDCLRVFMAEVQAESRYLSLSEERASSSPRSAKYSPLGTPVLLKYQAFPPGKEIKELRLDSSTSLADLYDVLRHKTRFPEFRVIFGGRPVDLRSSPDSTVQAIAERPGLLLVTNLQSDKLLPSTLDTSGSKTTAGKAISSRFDQLYPLLDLPDAMSIYAYNLLRQFPPHERVKETLSSDTPAGDLYHPRRTYKTLYSLHCLLQVVTSLDVRKDQDRQYLQQIWIKLLGAFVDTSVTTLKLETVQDLDLAEAFIQAVLHCLRLLPLDGSFRTLRAKSAEIVDRLCQLLLAASQSNVAQTGTLTRAAHDCLVEVARRDIEGLAAIVSSDAGPAIHEWLLIRNADPLTRQHAQRCTHALVIIAKEYSTSKSTAALNALWTILASLLPSSRHLALQSQHFFDLMIDICPLIDHLRNQELGTHDAVRGWLALLVNRRGRTFLPATVPDPFTYGLSRLISTQIICSRLTLQDAETVMWITSICNNLLFPPIVDLTSNDSGLTAANASVLHSEARKQVYDLLLVLCTSWDACRRVIEVLRELTAERIPDDLLFWRQDRFSLIRSPSGYAGLRNLTNTCYMNSLMTQLYMNPKFRDFILQIPTPEPGSQKLLAATQNLFHNMRQSQRKYADTEEFAYSVKPYDAPVIDVAIQMDVDEFYNLLFEQWEDQINDKEARKEFRSIYGGTSVTQIKSLDCDHISERVEEYLTVSCEVKGKHNLHESLRAFTAGDSMEGDNKYKCESCGNRYVNAVKRSCLKDIPDNLAFHLKRFDFDLVSMQRCKLYDYFAFPGDIDMAPYKYETVTGGAAQAQPDLFDLVGILVHSGSAEVGHYYSFIRDSASQPGKSARWFEFNDTDVTDFDISRVEEAAYGGFTENEQWRNWIPKANSAYMLFYQRRDVATQPASGRPEKPSTNATPDNQALTQSSNIAQENDALIRWFCLLDPEHGSFLRSVIIKIEDLQAPDSTEDHLQHFARAQLAATCVDYLHLVASRLKESTTFEQTAFGLESLVLPCDDCCAEVLDMIADARSSRLVDMVIHCPEFKTRTQTRDLIMALMQKVRSSESSHRYGLQAASNSSHAIDIEKRGAFNSIVETLLLNMEEIGRFSDRWDQYFSLLADISQMGRLESYALLTTDAFVQAMMLLFMVDPGDSIETPLDDKFYEDNKSFITRLRKQVRYSAVLEFVASLFTHLRYGKGFEGEPYERLTQADDCDELLPLTAREHEITRMTENGSSSFLVRCLEATSDNDTEAVAATSIVSQMLKNSSNPTIFGLVAATVQRQIGEFDFPWQHLPLAVAIPLCQFAPSKNYVDEVLAATRKKINFLDGESQVRFDKTRRPFEMSDSNGRNFTKFLMSLANMKATRWAGATEEYPFRMLFLEHSPTWALRLLQFDSTAGRNEALMAVRTILLQDVMVPAEGETHLSKPDTYRVRTWLELVKHACNFYFSTTRRVAIATRSQLMTALEQCIVMLRNIETHRTVVPAFDAVYNEFGDQYNAAYHSWNKIRAEYEESRDVESVAAEDGNATEEAQVSDVEYEDDEDDLETDRMSPSLNGSPMH